MSNWELDQHYAHEKLPKDILEAQNNIRQEGRTECPVTSEDLPRCQSLVTQVNNNLRVAAVHHPQGSPSSILKQRNESRRV